MTPETTSLKNAIQSTKQTLAVLERLAERAEYEAGPAMVATGRVCVLLRSAPGQMPVTINGVPLDTAEVAALKTALDDGWSVQIVR
jgi:hypothetical protein